MEDSLLNEIDIRLTVDPWLMQLHAESAIEKLFHFQHLP